ncbi:hypothetical protein [Pedobacter sp. Leaf250]|uniref:XAC2610-related protein n=1 Tax=Pedobacter sp. Leaf250 TaxID=2876559 RepID=UPI001E3DA3E4|nr:hypothetical protein [Pedobacter sp. Leaf250]
MRNLIIFFSLIFVYGCHTSIKNELQSNKSHAKIPLKASAKPKEEIQRNTSDSKIFNQCDPNCIWQYYHPFTDTSYVFAVQNCGEDFFDKGKTARIYFGIDRGKTDKIIWEEDVFIKIQNDFMEYKDFNGDDINDIQIFSETGARGANSFYFLYLVDAKKKQVIRVKHFEDIVNPEYNKKHDVILGYGFSATNHYSVYKISEDKKVYQIGASFDDDFDANETILDSKITEILSKNKQ